MRKSTEPPQILSRSSSLVPGRIQELLESERGQPCPRELELKREARGQAVRAPFVNRPCSCAFCASLWRHPILQIRDNSITAFPSNSRRIINQRRRADARWTKHSAAPRLCVEERIAMKTKSVALLAVLLTGMAHVVSAAADNLSAALQKGLLEEEANHNLDAAIQAYQAVVDQFGDQRRIAATAVFRL